MKRTLPRLLWTLAFFVIGSVFLAAFIGLVLPWSFHDDSETFYRKRIFAGVIGLICLIGLPSLGLILSIRGSGHKISPGGVK